MLVSLEMALHKDVVHTRQKRPVIIEIIDDIAALNLDNLVSDIAGLDLAQFLNDLEAFAHPTFPIETDERGNSVVP